MATIPKVKYTDWEKRAVFYAKANLLDIVYDVIEDRKWVDVYGKKGKARLGYRIMKCNGRIDPAEIYER